MSGPLPFGPYELVRRLGSGGMAETFLAVRRGPAGFEQHVCVKRILPAYQLDPEQVRMFEEEARLAAQLRHANITQVVDFGVVSGSHYLALELVDGLDLRALLRCLRERSAKLEWPIAVFVASELAAALDFAHSPEQRQRAPVIHRDISPSNVLLSRAGEVYLTDFGIARALGVKRQTESGVVRGKVPYMAPEYALTGRFDARSDLFALGVAIFEALAGQRPFDGATELDTLTRIKEGRHPPLAELAPGAPPSLVAIVEQLLVPDPNERFQSAAALLEALAHVAPPPTVSRQLAELVRSAIAQLGPTHALSTPSRTAAMPDLPLAPPLHGNVPGIVVAPPDAATRTSDATPRGAGWNTTDPTHVSLHDRESPLGSSADAPTPHLIPGTRALPGVHPPASPVLPAFSTPAPESAGAPAKSRSRAVWVAIFVGGALAFAAAGAGAYALVELASHEAP